MAAICWRSAGRPPSPTSSNGDPKLDAEAGPHVLGGDDQRMIDRDGPPLARDVAERHGACAVPDGRHHAPELAGSDEVRRSIAQARRQEAICG